MADDAEDEAANDDTRAKILSLQSENSRKREWLDRLKEKKRALDDELRAREEDKTELEDEIAKEARKQNENRENKHADNSQDEAVGSFVEKNVRGLLGERVPAFKLDDMAEEDSDDDAGGADEEQAPDDGAKQMHDSVIVTYLAPNPQEREKLDEYRCTYRVDKETTGIQLHQDACEFWGCSKDEFKLCQSDRGEPTELKPEQLAKNVTDDSILSKSKRAHLILCHDKVLKDRRELLKSSGVNLDIEEVIKKQMAHEVDDSAVTTIKHGSKPDKAQDEDQFSTAFQRWPGIFNLVRFTSHNRPVKNWVRIRATDICIYLLLALFTCISMMLRYDIEFYWLRNGVYQTVGVGIAGETSSNRLVNIQADKAMLHYDEMWDWARGSFHYQVFNTNSSLQSFYLPMGFLRVRQQKSLPKEDCPRSEVAKEYRAGPCAMTNTYESQDQRKIIMSMDVWINTSIEESGRQSEPDPLMWSPAQDFSANIRGYMQAQYDGSGYMVDYNLTSPNAGSTFLADMEIFKKLWLTKHSRVLIFEVLLANYNLGAFISGSWVFEISGSGAVKASQHLIPFCHGDKFDGGVAGLVLDILRALCVLYVMTLQVVKETKFQVSMGGNPGFDGLKYIFSFMGLVDASTVAMFVAMFYMRFNHKPPNPNDMVQFYSYSHEATLQERLFTIEGLFLFLICVRYCSFMKLNRHIDHFWKTLNRASAMFLNFLLIVIPLFLGAVFLANSIWSPYLYNFSTVWETIISLVFMIKQDYDLADMYSNNQAWTIPFIVYYYVLMTIFAMNGFLAISVHSYFQVQMTETTPKDVRSWTFDQWMDWILPGLLYKCVFRRPPGSSKREDRGDGDDGGGDEEDSDDDDDAKED